jgi:hypothetical protein
VASHPFVLSANPVLQCSAMRPRIFFRTDDIVVTATTISVGGTSYELKDWCSVRSERASGRKNILQWLRGPYVVLLSDAAGKETPIAHHRNAYFVFQLVHAIETALALSRKSAGAAGLVDASAAAV